MPICEIGTVYLAKPYTKEELEYNETHMVALRTLRDQPGCLRVHYDTFVEDRTCLCWLVEWENFAAHEAWKEAPAFTPSWEKFSTLLPGKNEPGKSPYMQHFSFSILDLLTSPSRSTLEVFTFTLYDVKNFPELNTAFTPITDRWTAEQRPWVIRQCLDQGKGAHVALIAAWRDIDEHNAAKEGTHFKEALKSIAPLRQSVQIFAHMTPGLIEPLKTMVQ